MKAENARLKAEANRKDKEIERLKADAAEKENLIQEIEKLRDENAKLH